MSNVIDVMKSRGFEFIGVSEKEVGHCFQFVNDEKIIVEVYAGKRYEMIYTNNEMFGLLTSGVLNNLLSDGLFQQSYIQFKEAANVLSVHFEGVNL